MAAPHTDARMWDYPGIDKDEQAEALPAHEQAEAQLGHDDGTFAEWYADVYGETLDELRDYPHPVWTTEGES